MDFSKFLRAPFNRTPSYDYFCSSVLKPEITLAKIAQPRCGYIEKEILSKSKS